MLKALLATVVLWSSLDIGRCHTFRQDNSSATFFMDAILHISENHLPKNLPLALLTVDMTDEELCEPSHPGLELLSKLFESNQWTMLTYGVSKRTSWKNGSVNKHGSVILFLNCEEFEKQAYLLILMFSKLGAQGTWNPRAKFVIVSNNVHLRNTVVNTFLTIASLRNVYDVTVLISGSPDTSSLDAYTWFPYTSRSQCGRQVQQSVWLNRLLASGKHIAFLRNVSLFPSKSQINFKECSVVFLTTPWPPLTIKTDKKGIAEYHDGLEIRILQAVARASNFKIIYNKRDRVEGQFGASWLSTFNIKQYDTTWPHYRGAVTWFVPRERAVPQWQSLVRIFDRAIWMFVFLSYILSSFAFWLIGNCLNKKRDQKESVAYSDITVIMGNAFSMLLCEAVQAKPRTGVSQMFYIIWVLYCMLINNAYQSSLIGILAEPGYLRPIQNVRDLLKSGIQLGIQTGIESTLKEDASDPQAARILASYITCNQSDMTYCLDRLSYDADIAVLGGRIGIEFMGYVNYTHNGKPLFVPFRDNTEEGHMSFYFFKGHMLVERFSTIVIRLQNAGLIKRWVDEIRLKYGNYFNKASSGRKFYVLTISHVQGAFYLILLGYCASVVCFSAEIVVHYCNKLRRRTQQHNIRRFQP